jgi:DNA-binding SARP family transcriptional activator
MVVSNGAKSSERAVALVRLGLLGGFRVEQVHGVLPDSAWQRRSAKVLTKLLATNPCHALHREQILEILWRDVDVQSSLNSFGKALYAARRAFEPELLPREESAYLHLKDEMLALDTEFVLIDSDDFQQLAEQALRLGTVSAYESALAAYTGELLPEDRYEDWSVQHRRFLAELHIQLLLGLADALEKGGAYGQAANRLRAVLHQDPLLEDVHRRLMRLYAETGARQQALRQFQFCQDALRRELNMMPERETEALYEDVLANRIQRRAPMLESGVSVFDSSHRTGDFALATPFVGRHRMLQLLREQLKRAEQGDGSMILLSGEAGVGKNRLVTEFVGEARRRAVTVLSSGSRAHSNRLPYAPFVVALEAYLASRPASERTMIARRYSALTRLVPSLGIRNQPSTFADRPCDDHLDLLLAIMRLLTDLSETETLVLVLRDLHDTHFSTVEFLQYLAHLTNQRRWLIIGTFREEGLEAGGELQRMLDATTRDRLCLHLELQRLTRPDCDQLVRALLPGGVVNDAFLDRIYTLSLGNPLFMEELIRGMQERNQLVLVDGYWLEASSSPCVPKRVRALVEMRVVPMDESARLVLALSAAAGMETTLTELRAAAAALQPPLSDGALFDALDRALKVRILEERNGGYAFRHPLVRAALYEELPSHRRAQIHAALAEAAV